MFGFLPLGMALYPGNFFIQVVLTTSLSIGSAAPLLSDYVHGSTKGLVGGYTMIALKNYDSLILKILAIKIVIVGTEVFPY